MATVETQGLRLAGSSGHFVGTGCQLIVVRSRCFLGDPGYRLLVNGWLEGDRAPCGLTLLQWGGAASSGPGAEHGAIPRVMHSRKSPTSIVPSWLCLQWTQSIITAPGTPGSGHGCEIPKPPRTPWADPRVCPQQKSQFSFLYKSSLSQPKLQVRVLGMGS